MKSYPPFRCDSDSMGLLTLRFGSVGASWLAASQAGAETGVHRPSVIQCQEGAVGKGASCKAVVEGFVV